MTDRRGKAERGRGTKTRDAARVTIPVTRVSGKLIARITPNKNNRISPRSLSVPKEGSLLARRARARAFVSPTMNYFITTDVHPASFLCADSWVAASLLLPSSSLLILSLAHPFSLMYVMILLNYRRLFFSACSPFCARARVVSRPSTLVQRSRKYYCLNENIVSRACAGTDQLCPSVVLQTDTIADRAMPTMANAVPTVETFNFASCAFPRYRIIVIELTNLNLFRQMERRGG